jgi:hypothetical protein
MKRAVNDFKGAVAELKQLADSLKQAGKFKQVPANAVPAVNSSGMAALSGDITPPSSQTISPD